jgi:hypothetical protein
LYFNLFSVSFRITFLSGGIAELSVSKVYLSYF